MQLRMFCKRSVILFRPQYVNYRMCYINSMYLHNMRVKVSAHSAYNRGVVGSSHTRVCYCPPSNNFDYFMKYCSQSKMCAVGRAWMAFGVLILQIIDLHTHTHSFIYCDIVVYYLRECFMIWSLGIYCLPFYNLISNKPDISMLYRQSYSST